MTDEWRPMETAPRDGCAILARIPGEGVFLIQWVWDGGDFETWAIADDVEPPADWCDGVCWGRNSEGKPSTQPDGWREA